MKPVPAGIALELLRLGIDPPYHQAVLRAMADAGDWYAQHWRSCGLLSGAFASRMCVRGHRPEPGARELSHDEVRALARSIVVGYTGSTATGADQGGTP